MRQILLSIKNPGKQLEVKDFLAECTHSSQWIGKVENWTISSVYFHDDKRHEHIATEDAELL